MKTRTRTVRGFGLLTVMFLGVIVAITGGSIRLASQSPPSLGATEEGYHRMTLGEYGANIFGPRALAFDLAAAGVGQALGRPSVWPKTWRGYGNRVATSLGGEAIAETIVFGVALTRDERPAPFALCGCTGNGVRLGHALRMPFQMQTPKGEHLSLVVPASEFVGALVVTSFIPGGFSLESGLGTGAVSVAGLALGAVAREFWPFHWRPFGL